jgi:peptidoglycan/xylan/chitin deacetylase (PgdA/CDA1 family)
VKDRLVLCYHAVADGWDSSLAVTPARLRGQLRFLLSRGYAATTFTAAMLDPPGRKTLAVTFDDAYRSVYELALPVLSELGVPGTVFVPTNFAGGEAPMSWPGIDSWIGGPHERELLCMSWEQMRRLAEDGWEVGSHTCSHPHLSELDDEHLRVELVTSRDACEQETGMPCTSLAYPYGDYDRRVREAVTEAGYQVAAGMPGRHRQIDRLNWPRVGVYPVDDSFRFRVKTLRLMRRVRSSPAWKWRPGRAESLLVGR